MAATRFLPAEAARHLIEVARCPIVESCLDGRTPGHPCSTVVLDQWTGVPEAERAERWRDAHQLPEPWDGHLETAPILFISSNPSIRKSQHGPRPAEQAREAPTTFMGRTVAEHPSIRRLGQGPRWTWSDEELVDRYEAAFDLYIADGVANRLPDGSRTSATRFWVEVRARARELIPHRPVVPGIDYALTEAVRCKSHREIGVADAVATCSDRYLRTTLTLSAAAVFVVLGRFAGRAVAAQLGLRSARGLHERVLVGGRPRFVVFMPHPNARTTRSFAHNVSEAELARMRDAIASREARAVGETGAGERGGGSE